jgi:hypothetical protein
MAFAQRRNRLTTHFSEHIPVVKWRMCVIWRMRFANWVTRAITQTHTQNMKYLLLFHCQNGYANAPQCCVMRTLPVLLLWVKVKVTLVQALRLCTGRTAHRGSRGIALLYRHRDSVQAVRSIGGVEVYLYCTGTEALYMPYGPLGE